MTLLCSLPLSLCQPGPDQVDGIGNYYLQIFPRSESQAPVSTIFLLDSHGQIPSKTQFRDYDFIKQSQIDWFLATSQELRKAREDLHQHGRHISLVFLHIPFPEYGDSDLVIRAGRRGEPTEGPSFNSHFYDALVNEGVAAVGCGHDHTNDFCAQKPQSQAISHHGRTPESGHFGPWLCHGGCSGFRAYCSYDGKRYHRRARVWELDTEAGSMKTWTRVEYSEERTDEVVLVRDGEVVPPI